jgi:CMP-N,N'-diacetyllegionaminic acid synthase
MQPLLVRSLLTAKQSKLTRLIVSTDSEQMAQVSKYNGGDVPFIRPIELAQDGSRIEDALLHGLMFCENQEGIKYEIVVLLQNSSPFRITEDIDNAINRIEWGFTSALTVSREDHNHPDLAWQVYQGESCRQTTDKYRRQDRDVVFYENGLVYAVRRNGFVNTGDLRIGKTALIEIPKIRALDIHDETDLIIANALVEYIEKG